MRTALGSVATALLSLVLVACSTAGASPSGSAAPSTAPSAAPSVSAASASPSADACATDTLELVTPGSLTIGTDNPAYPPYFEIPAAATDPWELGDPTTGMGFEGAFAYALAESLGFAREAVVWTVVPFANSFAPGPKAFDIDINQISYAPERATAVDMSDGYYFVNQSVVARKDTPAAAATSIADMKGLKFGAQVGTTSYDTIIETIAPTTETSVYDTNDQAIEGLKAGQIDALVVDLPTAFFITAAQMDDGVIVGQFEAPPGGEYFSVVLPKGSALTACVNAAISELTSSGELEAITTEWLSDKVNAPIIAP